MRCLPFPVALALSYLLVSVLVQGQSQAQAIDACTSRTTGESRLAESATACNATTETFTQWSATGQSGQLALATRTSQPAVPVLVAQAAPQPAGLPGASSQAATLAATPAATNPLLVLQARPGLEQTPTTTGLGPLFIIVPATDNYVANGQALANAVAASQAVNASATVVFQLGPGGYDVPSTLQLSPGYSLVGAGMLSTFIEPLCLTCAGNTTLSVVLNNATDTGNLSNLTIIGSANSEPLSIQNKGLFTIDHVRTLPGTDGANLLQPADGSGKFLVYDSLLGASRILTQGSFSAFNTELDPQIANQSVSPGTSKFLCSAVYTATGAILATSTCQ